MNSTTGNSLSDQFLGWQCRLRQHAVRKQEGVPPPGIKASVKIDSKFVAQINTVINKLDPETVTAEFRFMVQKTSDPKSVYENAIKYLSEYYFQYPKEFNPQLSALFALDSDVAKRLIDSGQCELGFYQSNQRYTLQAKAIDLPADSLSYQATYWHNHLFNPNLPGVVRILGFDIDWENSSLEQIK